MFGIYSHLDGGGWFLKGILLEYGSAAVAATMIACSGSHDRCNVQQTGQSEGTCITRDLCIQERKCVIQQDIRLISLRRTP